MYLDHFGLQVYPFSITPNTDMFYAGGGRGEIIEQLLQTIENGEGFIKLIGAIGSGKTIVCRMLCQRLPKTIQVALLLNPNLTPEQLVPALLQEFRRPIDNEHNIVTQRQILLDHLITLNRNGERALVLIEEAQSMPLETLEELRLLSNLETEQVKLMQIVLIGQPALDANLRTRQTRQILERITTSLTLLPLSLEETEQYLQSRLWATGYRGNRLFSPGALRSLHRTSKGGMRQINLLAHKALQIACQHGAYLVTTQHLLLAISTSEFIHKVTYWHRPALAAGSVAAILAAGIALHSSWALNPPLSIAFKQAEAFIMESALTAPLQQNRSRTIADETTEDYNQQVPPYTQPTPTYAIGLHPYLQPNDPLKAEIIAAHHWLATSDQNHFTIQMVLLQEESSLRRLKKQLAAQMPALQEIELKIFRLKSNRLLIYLNEFESPAEGLEVMRRLPDSLKLGEPKLRTLARAAKTIKKLAQSSQCLPGMEHAPCDPTV